MKPSKTHFLVSYVMGLFLIALVVASCSSNKNFSTSRYQNLKYVDKHAVLNSSSANQKSIGNRQKKEDIAITPASNQLLMVASSDKDALIPFNSFNHYAPLINRIQAIDKTQSTKEYSNFKIAKIKSYKIQQQSVLKPWKGSSAPASPNSGKSQLTALLLVIFLGGLGIHRFYLGYTWQGVVQLLTAGGCGIWALIDFIRIIMGTLEPKSGRYSKRL